MKKNKVKQKLFKRILNYAKYIFKQSFQSWLMIVKLIIPALIVVRLLIVFDLMPWVATFFGPAMEFVGLPAETSLVWIMGAVANVYGALLMLVTVLPDTGPLSVLQVSILGVMVLIAHNLPVESQVCGAAGVSPLRVTLLRILAAFTLGFIVFKVGSFLNLGSAEAKMILKTGGEIKPSWPVWALNTTKSLAFIFFIINVLTCFMEFLKFIGLTKVFMYVLEPFLKLAGVGKNAIMITIIGNILGLAYGGGLIIAESRSGKVPKKDVFASIIFMSIFHSVIEDTILVLSMGGTFWVLIVARLLFAMVLTSLITKLARNNLGQLIFVGKKYKY